MMLNKALNNRLNESPAARKSGGEYA